MHTTNLTKAAQAADLLLSDIRQAHSASTESDKDALLEMALLPLIEKAKHLEQELKAIAHAYDRSIEKGMPEYGNTVSLFAQHDVALERGNSVIIEEAASLNA